MFFSLVPFFEQLFGCIFVSHERADFAFQGLVVVIAVGGVLNVFDVLCWFFSKRVCVLRGSHVAAV